MSPLCTLPSWGWPCTPTRQQNLLGWFVTFDPAESPGEGVGATEAPGGTFFYLPVTPQVPWNPQSLLWASQGSFSGVQLKHLSQSPVEKWELKF